MRNNRVLKQSVPNAKGVTLIELLVVLVISGIVVGGIYKVFIAQTKAYTIQDQVAEIQQDVRGAMDIMVRDIQMAGFQNNNYASINPQGSALISDNRIVTPLSDSSIQVNYEYIPPTDPNCANYPNDCVTYQVTYQLVSSSNCSNPPCLQHTCNSTPQVPECNGAQDILLTNVSNLTFSYGIAATGSGVINGIDTTTGLTPNSAFQTAEYVNPLPTTKILAVRIQLTAKPTSVDPDVTTMVSPRTLTSVVIPRNIFFQRYNAY